MGAFQKIKLPKQHFPHALYGRWKILCNREWVLIRFACCTTYEVETSFAGAESLNREIIRLMLSEKIQSNGADNSEKARYNDRIHSVLSGSKKEEFE